MDKTGLKFTDEYKNLEIFNGNLKGTYKAQVVKGYCTGCSFLEKSTKCCTMEGGAGTAHCYAYKDGIRTDHIWIKTEEAPKTTPRPHADLISRWVSDANLKVWGWAGNDWNCIFCPTWSEDIIYAVATEKPTHIPTKMYIFTLIGKEYSITLPVGLSESEVEAKIKERVFEITEFSYKEA